MTLKESLFNKGIFQAIIRRFRLGALLYFIILFLCVPIAFLTQNPYHLSQRYFGMGNPEFTNATSVIFRSGFMILPVIVTFFASTVVALLVYNFVHSSRHAIFTHSLPVSRRANYISTLCASFTLLSVPIILNSIILIIMSLCGYGQVIGVWASVVWALILLCIVFIMFSVSTMAAFLTGNSFALVAINLILLLLPVAVAMASSLFGDMFLYGFTEDNVVFEKIIMTSPIVWITDFISRDAYLFFSHLKVWVFIGIALALYIASYFLYKNRRMEFCGDVAAFKIMRPILKYTVCAVTFIISLGIFSSMQMHFIFYYLLTVLVTSIAYFACEMVLRKNLRAFKFYKGLIAFLIVAAAILSFMAFTSVFGFETRIPDIEDIEEASLYSNYSYEIPYVKDVAFIKQVTEFHEDMFLDIPVVKHSYLKDMAIDYQNVSYITFKYKLKNGKELSRAYLIDHKTENDIMSVLFENVEYKKKVTGLFRINYENVKQLTLDSHLGSASYSLILNERTADFFTALDKDVSEMTYEEYIARSPFSMHVNLNLSYADNLTEKIFKPQIINGEENKNIHYNFSLDILPTFSNSIKILRDSGYFDELKNFYANNLYISTEPVYYENNIFTFLGKTYDLSMRIPIPADYLRKLSSAQGDAFVEDILTKKIDENISPYSENYYVFCANSVNYKEEFTAASHVKRYSSDNIPAYLNN